MPVSNTEEVNGFGDLPESGIMKSDKKIICKSCGLMPNEIQEYVFAAKEYGMSPDEYVLSEEGTYNKRSKKFYCTSCYIKAGMPAGTA